MRKTGNWVASEVSIIKLRRWKCILRDPGIVWIEVWGYGVCFDSGSFCTFMQLPGWPERLARQCEKFDSCWK